jgi:anaphase-promoting complex subunit 3
MDDEGSAIDESNPAPASPSRTRSPDDTSTRRQSDDHAMEIAECIVYNTMRSCARAFRAFANYDLQRCLDELEGLDAVQQRTPWVMALVGRAEYEKGDYAAVRWFMSSTHLFLTYRKSRRAFESLRDLDPYRILDMEVYSTLLWHTEKHIDLSFLAQELLSIEPRSPQTWIAIGNCFSLQKDKKQALTCFGRATQLDPGCAYAYTLAGHELVDTRIDQAINHFQSGIRADPRHYNAWWVISRNADRRPAYVRRLGMGWVHAI